MGSEVRTGSVTEMASYSQKPQEGEEVSAGFLSRDRTLEVSSVSPR
jgi:hypothetical protein